jgi:16S rRNA (cytidine1402-2'-O)-methyltransferase
MLHIVATPLGNPQDISLRALKLLTECDVVICESTKETSKLLRAHGVAGKKYEVLDEHSKAEDLVPLLEMIEKQNCVLVSDCGTPGFCDPGADLVRLARKKNYPIKIVPGPSSLAALLSVVGAKTSEFLFVGFIPAETEAREKKWKLLVSEKRSFVLMDTPYRLTKILEEIDRNLPKSVCVIVLDVSLETENILVGPASQLLLKLRGLKAEFMIWVQAD